MTGDVAFVGGTSIPPPDAFPPEPVMLAKIDNITTSSFVIHWGEPDIHYGRDVFYTLHFKLGDTVEPFTVIGNTAETDFRFTSLQANQRYTIRIDVTTNGGSAIGEEIDTYTYREVVVKEISSSVFLVVVVLASLFSACSLFLFGLVYIKREAPVIKASSVPFMQIILFGSLVGYASLFTGGHHSTACTVSPALLTLSFALTFGSLFARTYRLFKIFLSRKLQFRTITDRDLFGMLGYLVLFEVASLSVWYWLDMPQAVQVQDESDPFVKQWACKTNHPEVWWTVQLVPKFIVLTFGGFLAYRTRNIVERFNETKLIAFSLWNTFLFLTIALGLRTLIKDPDVVFLVVSMSVFVILGSTVGILFIPKIILLGVESIEDIFGRNTVLPTFASHGGGGGNSGIRSHTRVHSRIRDRELSPLHSILNTCSHKPSIHPSMALHIGHPLKTRTSEPSRAPKSSHY